MNKTLTVGQVYISKQSVAFPVRHHFLSLAKWLTCAYKLEVSLFCKGWGFFFDILLLIYSSLN